MPTTILVVDDDPEMRRLLTAILTRAGYAVRTADGHYAKLEIMSYYCAVVGTACVTFRYAYQGDGSRTLAVK